MKIRKISFIEPKSPGIHIFSKWAKIPRLGTIILGTILKRAGCEVRVFIEEISKINWSEALNVDLVCISTITPTAPKAYEYAASVKREYIPVILGGTHPSAMPDESLQYSDFVVRGEGEEIILPLIKAIEEGRGFENIKGLSYKLFGRIFHNSMPDNWCDINKYPVPDFSLVEGWKGDDIVPIQTSRGCPHNCKFCSVTKVFGRQLRHKTVERVIEEIKSQNCEYVFFCDDNFTADKEKTRKLLKGIIEEGLSIRWGAQVRVEAAQDESLVSLMKEAGCFMVYIGMESINPESLKGVRKKQTVDDIVESIKIFHRYGIKIHGMFVVGFDTDDIKTIRETVAFAKKEKIDSVQIMILTPLPGTETYEQLRKENRLLFGIGWDKYDAHHVLFKPNQMSSYRLQLEAIRASAKFYSLWQVIGQAMRGFLKRDWWSMAIRTYGNRLTKKWKKEIKDGGYLKKLKDLTAKLQN